MSPLLLRTSTPATTLLLLLLLPLRLLAAAVGDCIAAAAAAGVGGLLGDCGILDAVITLGDCCCCCCWTAGDTVLPWSLPSLLDSCAAAAAVAVGELAVMYVRLVLPLGVLELGLLSGLLPAAAAVLLGIWVWLALRVLSCACCSLRVWMICLTMSKWPCIDAMCRAACITDQRSKQASGLDCLFNADAITASAAYSAAYSAAHSAAYSAADSAAYSAQ